MRQAFEFWDAQAVESTIGTWMDDAAVRDAINRRIGGHATPAWPLEWFASWLLPRRFAAR